MNGTEGIITQNITIDFILQLFATLIGASIGFIFAIMWQRKTERTKKKEASKETLGIIISELKQMQDYIKNNKSKLNFEWDLKKREFKGKYATGELMSYSIALNSGNLILLPIELQHKLSTLNDDVNQYIFFMNETHRFYQSSVFLSNYANREASRLVNGSKDLLDKIEEEINELIPLLTDNKEKI